GYVCCLYVRDLVTEVPYRGLEGARCAASPLHVMHQGKKRGRPQIRTAEYWREYYTRKQRELRAAHPRIRTRGSHGNSQITGVRASAALAARHTTERE